MVERQPIVLPFPEYVTQKVAHDANRYAREWAVSQGWKGARHLHPYWTEGKAGIRSDKMYMIYQNRGFGPFLMKSLEGKIVPVGRRFRLAKDVGKPGFVSIPAFRINKQGEVVEFDQKVWRDEKWRHPGLKPKNFLERSISSAIQDNKNLLGNTAKKMISDYIISEMTRNLRRR